MIDIEIPNIKNFDEINKIAKQVHDLHVLWRPDIFMSVEEPIQLEYLSKLIKNKEIYVAKNLKNILGYVIVNIQEKKVHGLYNRKIMSIEVIVVDESHQNKGIGKQLMQHVLTVAKNEQCTDVQLSVNEENIKAIKCYESMGMRIKNIKYSMKI